jgi:hypothetical protein
MRFVVMFMSPPLCTQRNSPKFYRIENGWNPGPGWGGNLETGFVVTDENRTVIAYSPVAIPLYCVASNKIKL